MNAIESRRMRSKGQSGFTLIELLVVIAILGVLAGVVVFAVGGVTAGAKKNACKTEAKTIGTALEAFKADSSSNSYPTLVEGLAILNTGTTKYLKTNPTNNFTYTVVGVVGAPAAPPSTGSYAGLSAADCGL
jgi:type II secretion system protein G